MENLMSHADAVRDHCWRTYIEPARRRGEKFVAIRAGDVAKELNFSNRYPLVCAAIGANIFEDKCQVERIAVEGPLNGVNTTFLFMLKRSENLVRNLSGGAPTFRLLKICPKCGSSSEELA